jgi:hypothetical protein
MALSLCPLADYSNLHHHATLEFAHKRGFIAFPVSKCGFRNVVHVTYRNNPLVYFERILPD